MRRAIVTLLALASFHPGSSLAQPLGPTSADAERDRLTKSLMTSCRDMAGDAHWAELDRCNRAWFKKNEEAVWRLHLNPHMTRQDAPPS